MRTLIDIERKLFESGSGEVESSSQQTREQVTKWIPDTIADHRMPEGGRTLETYENQLGFSNEDVKEKTILDLGAGSKIKIAVQLEQEGFNSTVVELSPDFMHRNYRNKILSIAENEGVGLRALAGLAQELPFPSETFDTVLMCHVTEHIHDDRMWLQSVKEIARVLKYGGKAFIGPLELTMEILNDGKYTKKVETRYDYLLADADTRDYLTDLGITIDYISRPDCVDPVYYSREFMRNIVFKWYQDRTMVLKKHSVDKDSQYPGLVGRVDPLVEVPAPPNYSHGR